MQGFESCVSKGSFFLLFSLSVSLSLPPSLSPSLSYPECMSGWGQWEDARVSMVCPVPCDMLWEHVSSRGGLWMFVYELQV